MNNQSKKNLKWLLAIIGSVAVYHANANALEIKDHDHHAEIVQCLVSQGLITPLEQENWYQINQEKLDDSFAEAINGQNEAKRIIEMLQSLVGNEIDILEVNIFKVSIGTQDYAVTMKSAIEDHRE